jgi:ribose 1,5-bisphosphokinase
MITRPVDVGTEAHIEITPRACERRLGNGQFCLAWQAHGLDYGIPSSALALVRAGKVVVISVSRTVIREVRSCFPATYVIEITASPEYLRTRLMLRGLESIAAIEQRLARSNALVNAQPADFVLRNESTVDDGVRALQELLRPLVNGL